MLLVDRVGNDMGDATPVFRLGEELLTGHLLAGKRVPQAELGLQATIGLLASRGR